MKEHIKNIETALTVMSSMIYESKKHSPFSEKLLENAFKSIGGLTAIQKIENIK